MDQWLSARKAAAYLSYSVTDFQRRIAPAIPHAQRHGRQAQLQAKRSRQLLYLGRGGNRARQQAPQWEARRLPEFQRGGF